MGNNFNLESAHATAEILRRYPDLPRTWIQALHGKPEYVRKWLSRNYETLVTNHQDSFATPRTKPQPGARRGHIKIRPYCWRLTPSGEQFNDGRGYEFVAPGSPLKHQRACSIAGASFELATKEIDGLELITPEHILLRPGLPQDIRKSEHPWVINTRSVHIEPDAAVFGLRYGSKEIYFHGFELDRSSEKGAVIYEKMRMYQRYISERLNRELYKIPLPYFPWILRHKDRRPTIEAAIKSAISPEYQDRFIIQIDPETPDFPLPTGRKVTEPWYTTSGTLNLLDKLGVPNELRQEAGTSERAA